MKTDILFTIGSGDYKGKRYGFILAMRNGEKQWGVTPLFMPPPSIIKEEIEMLLMAQEMNIPRSGAMELKAVNKVLDQLRIIAKADSVTLRGLDLQERPVRIDENGFSVACITNETNREPEYMVKLTVWGMYS